VVVGGKTWAFKQWPKPWYVLCSWHESVEKLFECIVSSKDKSDHLFQYNHSLICLTHPVYSSTYLAFHQSIYPPAIPSPIHPPTHPSIPSIHSSTLTCIMSSHQFLHEKSRHFFFLATKDCWISLFQYTWMDIYILHKQTHSTFSVIISNTC
jgi:hypothetical protein